MKQGCNSQPTYNSITTSIVCENKTTDFVHDPRLFKQALAPSKGKRVIFVTLCGSFQTGKSSTIKKLTGDRSNSIQIGDGIRETTRGAFVYGPYSYNGIRTRYGIDVMSEDLDTYFVDTEGCNGFLTGGNNAEANTFLLSQLIAPYAALSNVLISILKTSMTSQEVDALNTMFGIIESIRQGTGRDVTRLMGVFTNVAGYDPHNNFDKAQEKISKIMRAKFQKIDLHEIIPLPQFNINNDIFHQSKQFDDAFDIFAQHLIQQIDESLQTSILDADSACEIFNALIKRTSKEDLTEVVRNAFKGKKSSETNYSKQVQDIIDNKVKYIQSLIDDCKLCLLTNSSITVPFIDMNSITNDAVQELRSITTEHVEITKFAEEFQRRISPKYRELSEHMMKIQKKIKEFYE